MVSPSRSFALALRRGGMTRRVRHLSTMAFMMLVLVFLPFLKSSAAEFPSSREYQLKATFLYNFIKFTEWPESHLGASSEPFVIGVFGKDPFGLVLDEVVQGETVHNKSIVVRRFSRMAQAAIDSHVLFISASEESQLPAILDLIEGHSVLTVSEIEHFAWHGGMIQLRTENNKVVFDINLEAVKRARLAMKAQLLKLAKIVKHKR